MKIISWCLLITAWERTIQLVSSSAIDVVDGYSERLAHITTLVLTMVAFKYCINDRLPEVSYLTVLDRYVLSAFGFLFAQAAEAFVAHRLCRPSAASASAESAARAPRAGALAPLLLYAAACSAEALLASKPTTRGTAACASSSPPSRCRFQPTLSLACPAAQRPVAPKQEAALQSCSGGSGRSTVSPADQSHATRG